MYVQDYHLNSLAVALKSLKRALFVHFGNIGLNVHRNLFYLTLYCRSNRYRHVSNFSMSRLDYLSDNLVHTLILKILLLAFECRRLDIDICLSFQMVARQKKYFIIFGNFCRKNNFNPLFF